MTATAVAGNDRDREIAALRSEVAALRAEVAALRVVKLGSEALPNWQQVIYPGSAGVTTTIKPWTNLCAGAAAPPVTMNYVVDTAGPAYKVPFTTQGAAGGFGGQVFTVLLP